MKPLRIKLAVEAGALATDGSEWHALRVGPVHDPDTGDHVIDVTDELCSAIALSFSTFGTRMRTVLGRDHGMFRAGGDKQSRGVVDGVRHAEGEGLFITPALNALGRGEVEAEEGSLWLSPTIFGPAFDPDSGERVADAWMPEVTLTPTPKQTGLDAVALARGSDAPVQMVCLARYEGEEGSANAHRAQLEAAAKTALAERGITPRYITVSDWSDTNATVNAWQYGDTDAASYDKFFRFDYADGPDGTPALTNPAEVVSVRTFEPIGNTTSLSRAAGATTHEEIQMDPTKVTLGRVEHDALLADRTKLGELSREHETVLAELARFKTAEAEREKAAALSRAEAFADTLVIEAADRASWIEAHVADAPRAETLSRALRRNVDVEAEAFAAELLGRGAIPADCQVDVIKAYKQAPAAVKAALSVVPAGATVPLGKPAGDRGRGDEDLTAEEQAAEFKAKRRALARKLQADNPGLEYTAALSRAAAELNTATDTGENG